MAGAGGSSFGEEDSIPKLCLVTSWRTRSACAHRPAVDSIRQDVTCPAPTHRSAYRSDTIIGCVTAVCAVRPRHAS